MRREIFRLDRDGARALLRRAPVVHFAAVTDEGAPLLRAVHVVERGEHLYFHGAPAGEKMAALGREAVLAADEIIAEVPSFFTDPERACPATTLYLSAQLHATLERVDEPVEKAAALQALMERYQPEGGHVPITADDPLYRKQVQGILIVRMSLVRLDGKAKLLQNRAPAEVTQVAELLWRRGRPTDARAVELVRRANPEAAPPPALAGFPAELRPCVFPDDDDARAAAALLVDRYWNAGRYDADTIAAAHRGSTAWVALHDRDGRLVASARALADGVTGRGRAAWIFDVIVDAPWRGRGVGRALTRLLLDHPAVRGCRAVGLRTRDAQRTYAALGFRPLDPAAGVTEMQLWR